MKISGHYSRHMDSYITAAREEWAFGSEAPQSPLYSCNGGHAMPERDLVLWRFGSTITISFFLSSNLFLSLSLLARQFFSLHHDCGMVWFPGLLEECTTGAKEVSQCWNLMLSCCRKSRCCCWREWSSLLLDCTATEGGGQSVKRSQLVLCCC
jgi:hypothetical protein